MSWGSPGGLGNSRVSHGILLHDLDNAWGGSPNREPRQWPRWSCLSEGEAGLPGPARRWQSRPALGFCRPWTVHRRLPALAPCRELCRATRTLDSSPAGQAWWGRGSFRTGCRTGRGSPPSDALPRAVPRPPLPPPRAESTEGPPRTAASGPGCWEGQGMGGSAFRPSGRSHSGGESEQALSTEGKSLFPGGALSVELPATGGGLRPGRLGKGAGQVRGGKAHRGPRRGRLLASGVGAGVPGGPPEAPAGPRPGPAGLLPFDLPRTARTGGPRGGVSRAPEGGAGPVTGLGRFPACPLRGLSREGLRRRLTPPPPAQATPLRASERASAPPLRACRLARPARRGRGCVAVGGARSRTRTQGGRDVRLTHGARSLRRRREAARRARGRARRKRPRRRREGEQRGR